MKIKKTICFIVGTRPNFIKAAPVYHEFSSSKLFKCHLIHTGQHYDENMSESFFKDLKFKKAKINLNIGSGSQAEQTANIMINIEREFLKIKPDWVFVFGDVNSTLAASIVAKKLFIKIAHIESGLRSNDMMMPEEINRILTDKISDLCFITEKSAKKNLLSDGISKSKIKFVGNTMIDSLVKVKNKISNSDIVNKHCLEKKKFILVTLHRPSNVDNDKKLQLLINKISYWNEKNKIIWPVHPRIDLSKLKFKDQWKLIPPQTYLNFLSLMYFSKGVFTDSGGIQEESTYLNIPCFTLRENTERPITCIEGTNFLVKKQFYEQNIWNYKNSKINNPELWDGNSSARILNSFIDYIK